MYIPKIKLVYNFGDKMFEKVILDVMIDTGKN